MKNLGQIQILVREGNQEGNEDRDRYGRDESQMFRGTNVMNTYRGTYGQITNGSLSEERSTKERWMIDRQIEMVYA